MYEPIYYNEDSFSYRRKLEQIRNELPLLIKAYFLSLFPIHAWILRYNLTWLMGDLIAGITIGCVVVPQGMAYAKLASLPVQYGLYSSFAGVCTYCLFATSKDITIGPVAVMSLLIAEVLGDLHATTIVDKVTYASTLALFAGFISLFIGLFRLGFIIDFISGPAIAGFMSGSALSIGISQMPGLFGIASVNNRLPSYLVFGKTLGALGQSKSDAAFGLIGLAFLYAVKYGTQYLEKKYPKSKRVCFFLNTSRSFVLVLVSTIIAYGISYKNPNKPPIKLNGFVPSGFKDAGVPDVTASVLSKIAPHLPVVVLILVLEHVAISKSFGRLNDYVINPNQELIAIGVSNIIGSFFSAYPATGSFSRTAIKARAGVRTPLAGVFSGIVVLIALYALTGAFFYIPSASLCAVIIHAVADLFSGYKIWKMYWNVNPLELLIFWVGVIVTFFSSVENGIYATMAMSLFLLLVRIARPRFSVLGRVKVPSEDKTKKYVYVPVQSDALKTNLEIEPMPAGVVAVRLEEAYTYPNASYITDKIIDAAKTATRTGAPPIKKKGDRNWNDRSHLEPSKDHLPLLRAMVIDCASVSTFDSTALQSLTSARATLDRYAGHRVEWHFANISDAGLRDTLVRGGFGGRTPNSTETQFAPIVPSLNTTQDSLAFDSDNNISELEEIRASNADPEHLRDEFIHYDLDDAVRAAAGPTDSRPPTAQSSPDRPQRAQSGIGYAAVGAGGSGATLDVTLDASASLGSSAFPLVNHANAGQPPSSEEDSPPDNRSARSSVDLSDRSSQKSFQ